MKPVVKLLKQHSYECSVVHTYRFLVLRGAFWWQLAETKLADPSNPQNLCPKVPKCRGLNCCVSLVRQPRASGKMMILGIPAHKPNSLIIPSVSRNINCTALINLNQQGQWSTIARLRSLITGSILLLYLDDIFLTYYYTEILIWNLLRYWDNFKQKFSTYNQCKFTQQRYYGIPGSTATATATVPRGAWRSGSSDGGSCAWAELVNGAGNQVVDWFLTCEFCG